MIIRACVTYCPVKAHMTDRKVITRVFKVQLDGGLPGRFSLSLRTDGICSAKGEKWLSGFKVNCESRTAAVCTQTGILLQDTIFQVVLHREETHPLPSAQGTTFQKACPMCTRYLQVAANSILARERLWYQKCWYDARDKLQLLSLWKCIPDWMGW